jgi:hypothetical protein
MSAFTQNSTLLSVVDGVLTSVVILFKFYPPISAIDRVFLIVSLNPIG